MASRTPIHEMKNEPINSMHFYDSEGMTVQKLFHANAAKFKNRKHLGTRPFNSKTQKYGDYEYLSYFEVEEMVKYVGSGLLSLGLHPKDKIGIMSKNNLQWGLTDYACACYGLVVVPVYDSLPPADCEYIACHSEIKAIVISKKHIEFISKIKNSGSSKLEIVIVIDDDQSGDMIPFGKENVILFSELISMGKRNVILEEETLPDDVYTIVYTSGTTGVPKGAVLTQNNVVSSSMMASALVYPNLDDDEDQEVICSFLPLAHIFGRVLDITAALWGGRVAYFTGNIPALTDDFRNAKITFLAGVPRVFIRSYNLITKQIASAPWYKRWIFNTAYWAKLRSMVQHKPLPAWADKLVFNKVKETMGGRVRYVMNGGSTLPQSIKEYISVCFGCFWCEGFGQTESAGVITIVRPLMFDPQNVGVPGYKSQVCLESLHDMGYNVTDKPYPRGEVLVRGPQVFKGYFKDEENTAAMFDSEGWFRTGDVGMWVPGPFKGINGESFDSLRIIDRKKNIFKLAQGEYVVADRVEAALLVGSPYLRQLIVYAPSTSVALVAIVVPEWDTLLDAEHAAETGSELWKEAVAIKEGEEGGASSSSSSSSSSASAFTSASASASLYQFPRAATPEQPGGELLTLLSVRRVLAQHEGVRSFLLQEIRRVSELESAEKRGGRIKRFEIPRGVVVCPEEFTEMNKCLTPSQKIRRDSVRAVHADAFAAELARVEKEIKDTKRS